MTKRSFRLEQVLNERKRRQEARQQELAGARQRLTEGEKTLRELRREADAARKRMERHSGARLSAQELRDEQAFLERLAGRIDDQDELVRSLAMDVTSSRDALSEALKEKKVIERLKEKHLLELAEEEKAAEGRAVDDIVTTRFVRRHL